MLSMKMIANITNILNAFPNEFCDYIFFTGH